MEKEQLRTFIKDKLKSMGFQSRKSINYMILDDDYLIALELYPCTYGKMYQLICGVIYLPDDSKMPPRGIYDFERNFHFPLDPNEHWDQSVPIQEQKWGIYLKYEMYSQEKFEAIFDYNIEQIMKPLYDKQIALGEFRRNWKTMRRFSPASIEKLCHLANLDTQEVLAFLGKTLK